MLEGKSQFGSKTGQLNGPFQSSESTHIPGIWPAFPKLPDGKAHNGCPLVVTMATCNPQGEKNWLKEKAIGKHLKTRWMEIMHI